MRRTSLIAIFAVISLLAAHGTGGAAAPKLPLVGGKPALAVINGEPLTLEEFDRALAMLHEGMTDNAAVRRTRPLELLGRLINAKLILQEARNIGLDALPEVTVPVTAYKEDLLRAMLSESRMQKVKTADRKEVEKRYRDAVKEIKVVSILMEKEEDGRRMDAEVKGGADYDEAAKRRIAAGEAKGSLEGRYMKYGSLSPEIAAVVSTLKKGEVSPVVKVEKGFTMVKLEDIRFPEDPAARKKAERDALQAKRAVVWTSYVEGLKKKYVKVNANLLESLDYDSPEPGIGKLSKDQRIVAEVKGENPVTVMDLTQSLERRFFHGAERAAEGKKINKMKGPVLEDLLMKRITLKEAKRRGFDRTERYRSQAEEYLEGIIFGVFLQKVVDPDIRVEDAEGKTYYREHLEEFTEPEMVRIDSIAFPRKENAESAIDKLRKGADFHWLRTNAEGRLDGTEGKELLEFRGNLLTTASLPEGVQKALSGAAEGEYRIYSEPGGPSYLLSLRERVPSKPRPYEAVRDDIVKTVFLEKRNQAFRDWEEKLRKASEVKIFVTEEKLDRIVIPQGR